MTAPKLPILSLKKPIRVIVSDLDGCLTSHDWTVAGHVLTALQDYAKRAETDPAVPLLTFNTGRPLPYVECMARVAHVTLPVLCESGIVLYDIPTRGVHYHPSWKTEDRARFNRLAELAHGHEGHERDFILEPGKMVEFTLLPRNGTSVPEVEIVAKGILLESGASARIDTSNAVVSIIPEHLHKGTGLAWFAERTGYAFEEMASIGDSNVDWTFMQMTAASWAPSNATAWLRERATVASTSAAGDVLLEAFESVIEANRLLFRR